MEIKKKRQQRKSSREHRLQKESLNTTNQLFPAKFTIIISLSRNSLSTRSSLVSFINFYCCPKIIGNVISGPTARAFSPSQLVSCIKLAHLTAIEDTTERAEVKMQLIAVPGDQTTITMSVTSAQLIALCKRIFFRQRNMSSFALFDAINSRDFISCTRCIHSDTLLHLMHRIKDTFMAGAEMVNFY